MKRKLSILFLTIIMNLVLVGYAFATDVDVHGYRIYSGVSPDWGAKSFRVDYCYTGNQYAQSGAQYVDGHDVLMFSPTIYNPEIPMGYGTLSKVELINSSGTAVSTLTNSNFSNGLIRSYWYSGTCLLAKSSYSWLYCYPDASYYAKLTAMYQNPEFFIYC